MLLIVPKYKLWITSQPLGALCVASVLRKKGESVALIDGICETHYYEQISKKITEHSTVGISANIAQAYSGVKTAEFIRKKFPDKKIIWGGPYSSVEYKKLIPELADMVVNGEGETQIAAIAEGVPIDKIPGLAYWDKKKERIAVNPRTGFIEDLDTLPYPAWDLVAGNHYFTPGLSPSFIIVTERGCPFHCINCTKVIHGDKFRTRSVEHVIGELELLVNEFNAKEFHIWDDNFTLYPDRTKKICKGIIAKGIHKKARFVLPNGIRADICDEEMFDLMREANFQVIIIAIESADQQVIDKLKKGLDLRKVRKTVETTVDKGFRVGLFFMMGLPFDTVESLKKTAKFAASLPAHHAFFWKVTPFPGTKLYDMTVGSDQSHDDYSTGYIHYGSSGERFVHSEISPFRLTYCIRMAYLKFYGNPVRLFRILRKIMKEKVLLNDLYILLKCGIKILFTGHR